MGKKSRAKKYKRQEIARQSQEGQAVVVAKLDKQEEKETGLSQFFLWIIRGGVFLVLVTPLIISSKFYFPFVGPKSLYFMGLAQIVIFSWLGLAIINKKYRPRVQPVTLALLLFFVILFLSAVFGVNWPNSFWSKFERMTGILMFFHLVGLFLVLSSVFKKDKDWQNIFTASLGVALIIALMALFGQGGSTRGGATVGNTSFMGTYLLFNIFFALYLFFKKKNIYWKIGSAITAVILFLAVYLAYARAATLSIIGGLVLFAFAYFAFKAKHKGLRIAGKALLIISLVIALATIVLLFQEGSFVRDKFIEQASRSRLVVWEKAWEGFKERPLLGWGPENFEFAFEKHFNPCMFLSECGREIWFDRAHNIVFDTLVNSGALGFITYFGLFLIIFVALWRGYFKKRVSFLACAMPSALLVAYLVQNLTVFDMISSYLMFFLVISFANVASYQEPEPAALGRPDKRLNKRRWPLVLLLVGFLFSFIFFVIQPARSGNAIIKALQANNTESRQKYYKEVFTISPLGRLQSREFLAQHTFKSVNQALNQVEGDFEKLDKESIIQELDLVSAELEKIAIESPLDFRSALKLAEIYTLYFLFNPQKLELAQQHIERAIGLSPSNQQGYWNYSQIKLYQKNASEAMALAQKAIDLEPRWYQSHSIAAQIAKFAGDPDLMQKVLNQAIAVDPKWGEDIGKIFGLTPPEVEVPEELDN